MSGKTSHFLKLMRVEFEDIGEDIGLLESISMERLNKSEITEYVYNENFVFFEQERRAVHSLVTVLEEAGWTEYIDMDELLRDLRGAFAARIAELQFPPAVMELIDRKLEKIHQFILS